jgi:hypothetical protein
MAGSSQSSRSQNYIRDGKVSGTIQSKQSALRIGRVVLMPINLMQVRANWASALRRKLPKCLCDGR